MSGPGDRAFVRWAKRYISIHDAKRVLGAYKEANLITVDNRTGTFRVLNLAACSPDALEAAAENLRPAAYEQQHCADAPPVHRRSKRWNGLTDNERQRLVSLKRSVPDQWERQERIELAIAKLNVRCLGKQ